MIGLYYYALDDEWCGDDTPWEDEIIKGMMEKYNLSKEEVLKAVAIY